MHGRRVFGVGVVAALAACASAGGPGVAAARPLFPPAGVGALASFAGQRVAMLPVQGVSGGPRPAGDALATDSAVLAALDGALERALGARGMATQWTLASALVRTARRNPTYVPDPAALHAGPAVRAALRRPGAPLTDPLAAQARTLAGMGDARYVLVPVELRVEPATDGAEVRLRLALALLDARGGQAVWAGEVTAPSAAALSAAMVEALAQRVAGLVVPS